MYVKVERLCCRLERSLTEMGSIFRSPEYSLRGAYEHSAALFSQQDLKERWVYNTSRVTICHLFYE